jgi:serine/threonine protein kinase/tetratricopeptide (TPR) repeat protein
MLSMPSERPLWFEFGRKIGSGGFGVVYEVFDRVRGQRLALKQLSRLNPESLYRFKQEFRALADVEHPNLVKLYELFSEPSGWSFTMELVSGLPFDEWVCREGGIVKPSMAEQTTVSILSRAALPRTVVQRVDSQCDSTVYFHEARLREAFNQLVLGVATLHARAILHRDLKPSNVLVDNRGRLVILDFGMVATGVVDDYQSTDSPGLGTPLYMSPEQARGAALTVASDWYAVGVMLYHVLSGRFPFAGTYDDILLAKSTREPQDPRETRDGLPNDLVDLCMRLLHHNPAARPSGSEVMSQLHSTAPSMSESRRLRTGTFTGRREELARLNQAFMASRKGNTVVVHVYGRSGHGKSALVRRFLGDLASRETVVILDGRCYQRESVPFKALDDLLDALYRYLKGLGPVEAATFAPRHPLALVQLFPILGRLQFMMPPHVQALPTDPHELRQKAFSALREMLAKLADRCPLVLFVDDIQWGDVDSATLIRSLLTPPDVPSLLLVVAYRAVNPSGTNELVRTLRSPLAKDGAWESIDIALGPLPTDDATELAKSLLRSDDNAIELAQAIARESDGSPLFVAELARLACAGQGCDGITLQRLVADKVKPLPEEARKVMDVLACSEHPLSGLELETTTELPSKALTTSLELLCHELLVTDCNNRGRVAFEILHDKVRRAILDGITCDRERQCHLRLAEMFSSTGLTDPETLAHHYMAAGDSTNALRWTEAAADRATKAVAFNHAVILLEQAFELADGDARLRIGAKLAGALAQAGRGKDSAHAYLKAANRLSGDAARDARQAAAEQYLRSGYIEEALETFGPLLRQSKLAFPRSPGVALISLLWRRTILRLRGTRFHERKESEVPADQLRAIDLCSSIAVGLAGLDLVRSARYQAASLQMALRAGEPYRVARALSIEALTKAMENADGVETAKSLVERSFQIAHRIKNPLALAWATGAKAVIACRGDADFPLCLQLTDESIRWVSRKSLGFGHEIACMEVCFALDSTFLMGDIRRLAERATACAREAAARCDRFTLSSIRAYILPFVWAAQDQIEIARNEAQAAIAVWPDTVWYDQHWGWLRTMCFLDFYEGNGVFVLSRIQKHRRDMKRTMQLRDGRTRFDLCYLEGRCAVDFLYMGDNSSRYRKLLISHIRDLVREQNQLASAYAEVLKAGLLACEAGQAQVSAAFEGVSAACRRLSMPMHSAAADWRRGQAMGGESGKNLVSRAKECLVAHGIANPARFADMLMPRVEIGS